MKNQDVETLFFADTYARIVYTLVQEYGMSIKDAFYAFFTSDYKKELERIGLHSLYFSEELLKEMKENYLKTKPPSKNNQ